MSRSNRGPEAIWTLTTAVLFVSPVLASAATSGQPTGITFSLHLAADHDDLARLQDAIRPDARDVRVDGRVVARWLPVVMWEAARFRANEADAVRNVEVGIERIAVGQRH